MDLTSNTAAPRPRSARKRAAILAAAEEVFLSAGFLGATMDVVAAESGVSKQTVYHHFGSKEALFVEIVTSMTAGAGDQVQRETRPPERPEQLAPFLRAYAHRQLDAVLTPRLMRLRRLVIAEVGRFPELARVLHAGGPQRAITNLTHLFAQLGDRQLLTLHDDPRGAATHFNWLVMAEPLNRAMLLGDDAIPAQAERHRHGDDAVRVFLAAYGPERA